MRHAEPDDESRREWNTTGNAQRAEFLGNETRIGVEGGSAPGDDYRGKFAVPVAVLLKNRLFEDLPRQVRNIHPKIDDPQSSLQAVVGETGTTPYT